MKRDTEMLIEIKNINKNYRDIPVLKDINFCLDKGDYYSVTGPSGSGKSTLMNILGCIDNADSGSYYLCGNDTTKMNEREKSKYRSVNIGFVFQSFLLLPSYTALENVELPMMYAGVKKKLRKQKAEYLLEITGLKDRMNHKPSELSGGQCQRVAISRALSNEPEILLADEPTGNLDKDSTEEIMNVFEKLNGNGTSIILITHDIKTAERAKNMLYLNKGSLICQKE